MTKDFLLGFTVALLLVAVFVIWLFERNSGDTPPDEATRQPVTRYSGNVTELEREAKIS